MYLDVAGAEPLVVGAVPATLPATGETGPATFTDGADGADGADGTGGSVGTGSTVGGDGDGADGGRRWRFAAVDLGVRGTGADCGCSIRRTAWPGGSGRSPAEWC
nr:hypothetical protein GCM10020093_042920 [Planobispora longispora]